MNAELENLIAKRESATRRVAEVREALLEAEYLNKKGPGEIQSLKMTLAGLLADGFMGVNVRSKIKDIEHEIISLSQRLDVSGEVIRVLSNRIETIKTETGLPQISRQICQLEAAARYPIIRDQIIADGELPKGEFSSLRTLAANAGKAKEFSRLVDMLEVRAERNDRRPLTFECDAN